MTDKEIVSGSHVWSFQILLIHKTTITVLLACPEYIEGANQRLIY